MTKRIEMIKFQKVFRYKVIPTKPLHFFELSWDISYICKDLASSSTLIKLISLLSFTVVPKFEFLKKRFRDFTNHLRIGNLFP